VFSKSKIFKFLKRDCGTIPVAEIINGKIEIFSKHLFIAMLFLNKNCLIKKRIPILFKKLKLRQTAGNRHT
jgi:hypothetical protein